MGTTVEAPPPRDYGAETRDTLQAQIDLAPKLYQSEAEYLPQYQALNMRMLQDSLRGASGSPGLLSLYESDIGPALSRMEADSLSKQRAADIGAVEQYGRRATEAMRQANPELFNQIDRAEALGTPGGGTAQQALLGAAMAGPQGFGSVAPQQFATDRVGARSIYGDAVYGDRVNAQNVSSGLAAFDRVGNRDVGLSDSGLLTELNRQAMEELQAGQSLTAAEQRAAQQASRAAFASRGLAMGDQAVADEVLRNYQLGAERQNQRRAFAQNVEQQNRAFAGQGLQAQQTNQDAALRAALANQQGGIQTGQFNVQNNLQAQLANQQAWMEAGRLNQATGLQAQLANQQTGLQAQQANQQAWMEADRLNQATGLQQGLAYQQLGLQAQLNNRDFANQLDARRFQQLGQASEIAQRQQAGDRGYAGQLVGLRQGTSQDPFMAILGRPSQAFAAGQGFGNQAMGYAQSGGPTLFNPESSYAGNMYNQQWQGQLSANTASAANNSAILGAGIGAIGQIGGGFAKCWVAREVYGAENPRWLLFRDWLETTAPDWFHSLYIRFGERFARCIRPFPRVKAAIRRWMDSKINERG